MSEITTDVGPWSLVPEWISDAEQSGLSHAAVRLYAVLMLYADGKTGEGATPSRATLARRMGLKTTDRVDAAKRELVEFGALEAWTRADGNGRQTSNGYRLRLTPPGGRENSVGGQRKLGTPPPRKLGTNHNHSEPKASPNGEADPAEKTRRDPVWDVLADRFGAVAERTNAHAKRNKAVADLKRLGATAESVEAALKAWTRVFDGTTVTDVALATHYPQLLTAAGWKDGRPRTAAACPECGTGGGLHVADCPRAAVAA